jgi:signal transduction histidine kinase
VESDFSASVLRTLLWVGWALSLAGFGAYLATGQGAAWHGPLSLAVLSLALFSLRGRRAPSRWLAWSIACLGPLIMLQDTWMQRGVALPATLGFWSLSIINTGFLLGLRAAAGSLAVGVAVLLLGRAWLPWDDGAATHYAMVYLISWSVALLICGQAMAWQRSVLLQLERRRQDLALGLRLRRRLLGTLFHDVANPLGALLAIAELGRGGLAGAGDLARARRLSARLSALLQGGQAWILDAEGPVALEPVDLEGLSASMADLYADRLAAKRLGLSLDLSPGLKVQAHPAILRDSALSNLVGNAIKFSQPGAVIELRAQEHEGWACLSVLDRGPGLEPGLLAALEQGRDLPSRSGSAGEEGQGLGLLLAREHLQRMGGRLELLPRQDGGVEARLWLRPA